MSRAAVIVWQRRVGVLVFETTKGGGGGGGGGGGLVQLQLLKLQPSRLLLLLQRRCFHSTPLRRLKQPTQQQSLSRAERRALERKQRNQERRQKQRANQQQQQQESSSSSLFQRISQRLQRQLQELFHFRIFGSGRRLQWSDLWPTLLLYRLPVACILAYMATHPDIAPYRIQPSLGPSMLPTIQFNGDVWLVENTGSAWCRLLQAYSSFWNLQVGDVILWKDNNHSSNESENEKEKEEQPRRVSCKRIIGMPGDVVKRYGEYAHLYQQQGDESSNGVGKTTTATKHPRNRYGIVWPKNDNTNGPHRNKEEDWDPFLSDKQDSNEKEDTVDRTLVVPPNHVWIEGDCPLFSLDSRHYGPIPMDWICGRLLFRLWPWADNVYFQDFPSRKSRWIRSLQRPTPFDKMEDYLGKPFNFYRISSSPSSSSRRRRQEDGDTTTNVDT